MLQLLIALGGAVVLLVAVGAVLYILAHLAVAITGRLFSLTGRKRR